MSREEARGTPPAGCGGEGDDRWATALAEREERVRRAYEAAAEAVAVPAEQRGAWIAGRPDCLCPEFVELMIAMARERRGEEPRESVRFAHLAVTAAEEGVRAGREDGDDARALAWAELGNAHRICGDLRLAGIAFHHARERLRCVADPLVRAEVCQIEAAYRNYLRDFETEDRLLAVAERIQRRHGTPHDQGLVSIMRAETARLQGEHLRAVDLLMAGLKRISVRQAPRLAVTGLHNLAICLIEVGLASAAFELLRRSRPAYLAFAGPRDRALRQWMEARAATAAGRDSLGLALLAEVRERFVELQSPYELALVNLDLTTALASQDDPDSLQALAAETLEICRGCGLGSEAIAAAILLDEAARRRQASEAEIAARIAGLRRHLAPKVRL